MKIGYLFSRYPVPSQTFCDTEMRALEERGFSIEIFSCSSPLTSFRHDAGGRPQAPVFYAPPAFGLEAARQEALAQGTWPTALIAAHEERFGPQYEPGRRALHAVAFAGLLQRRGVEHVHVHFANRATHAALFLKALTGIPFSFTAHAQDFLVDLGSDALLQEMCAQAAFVVTVSDFSRRALLEKCPEAAGKTHRVYNGLPLARWPLPPSAAAAPAARTLQIFSAGRLIDFKGFDDLITACALLRRGGVAFRLEVAGEGPAHAALERQVAELGLAADVHLLGLCTQAEIRGRMAACDVFALAARVDTKGASDVLPTVILEAMAAGRAVVSTRLAGIPEMVGDGETGLLVEPGETAALAAAIASLAGDPEWRGKLGAAGRARVEEQFSAERASAQLAPLFAGTRATASPAVPALATKQDVLVVLLDGWPEQPGGEPPPFAALLGVQPETHFIALRSAPRLPASQVEYLPDAMVLEAEWRESAAMAHRLEGWRNGLGAGLETGDFLLAAKRALYLHERWRREPPAARWHLHAAGPAALLCAWLLLRLDLSPQASFLLPPAGQGASDGMIPNAVLKRLVPAFVEGWLLGNPRLAAELGTAFHGPGQVPSAEDWHGWQTALVRWAALPPT